MQKIIRNTGGMTLLEIIIALAIVGIMSIGILSMLTSGFKFITKAGDRSEATFTAQSQIEQTLNSKNTNASALGIDIAYDAAVGGGIHANGEILQGSSTVNGTAVNVDFFQPAN